MENLTNFKPEHLLIGITIFSILFGIILHFLINESGKEKKKKQLPNRKYKEFDTTRSKEEFDMDDEEIKDFIVELKEQVIEELPQIEEYIKNKDYMNLKSSVHKIKGSAVNLAEGGIAEALYEFNHYLSENGTDEKIINEFYEDVKYFNEKL